MSPELLFIFNLYKKLLKNQYKINFYYKNKYFFNSNYFNTNYFNFIRNKYK